MSLQKLLPSAGDSSPISSNSSISRSDATSCDPRRDPSRDPGQKEVEGQVINPKRRRVPDSVTRNACLNCKKARAKHAKEELIGQLKELKAKDLLMEQILQALSSDNKAPDIIKRLKHGETYENIVNWLSHGPKGSGEEVLPRVSVAFAFEREPSGHDMTGIPLTAFTWTSVISDTAVLGHLFRLYFAWVHPVHTLFSEGYFIDSYKKQSELYCSSVLVNALCAMACRLHSVSEADDVEYEQLEIEFSDAVRTQIDPKDENITTTQALAVMFLLDCARARGLRSSSYLEMAKTSLANITEVQSDGFLAVFKDTVRGIRNLSVLVVALAYLPLSTLTETVNGRK
ncbi:hypothetical protein B7463_g11167, partial [Scytalidium lignicola]